MKKKKLLSVLAAAALGCSLFSAVPVVSHAAEPQFFTSGDYTFCLDNSGRCRITEYNGSDTDIVIPSTLSGRSVVSIGVIFLGAYDHSFMPFEGNKNITSVTIPDSVQTIEGNAFEGCSNLGRVDLGHGVSRIGQGCFKDCKSLTTIEIPASINEVRNDDGNWVYLSKAPFSGCDSLKTVIIERGASKIPSWLFVDCSALERIVIPEGVTKIEASAFSRCSLLKEVSIPGSIQSIGRRAFRDCTSLEEIKIPNSGQVKIGAEAFDGCSNLKDFYDYNENANAEYEGVVMTDNPFLTIHGFSGSNAEKYAKEHGIPFVPLTEKLMYRLYNPNSGEHLYTSNSGEKDSLVSVGWKAEGTAWIAPDSSNTPVYRVYNPNSGEHHYTMSAAERDTLVGIGWNDEGIGWYSDDSQTTPLYRLYNPYAVGQYEAGAHHYTKDVNERNTCIAAGWRDEGIGWYGK